MLPGPDSAPWRPGAGAVRGRGLPPVVEPGLKSQASYIVTLVATSPANTKHQLSTDDLHRE